MKRRIIIYLFGFGIGCVLVSGWFERDGENILHKSIKGWLPEGRVLNKIEYATKFTLDSNANSVIESASYSTHPDSLRKWLLKGDIEFAFSQPQENPPFYQMKLDEGPFGVCRFFVDGKTIRITEIEPKV